MIFFLASLLERFLNFLAPSRTVFPEHPLADVEADTEVFEPDELWAAAFRRRWEQHDAQFDPDCPQCQELLEDPMPQKESPRAAATAGGTNTEKGTKPMSTEHITKLRDLLQQSTDDEISYLRAENEALRNAIAKMESRPIPYSLTNDDSAAGE